jgi:hypothetical protein
LQFGMGFSAGREAGPEYSQHFQRFGPRKPLDTVRNDTAFFSCDILRIKDFHDVRPESLSVVASVNKTARMADEVQAQNIFCAQ